MTTTLESPAPTGRSFTREQAAGPRDFVVYVVRGHTREGLTNGSAGWIQIASSGFLPGDDWDDEFGPSS